MVDADTAYGIRVARPGDRDAVGTLLVASYSNLLIAHYGAALLRRALPQLTRANPALIASGTYYVAERRAGELVGCGGWTAACPSSGEIIEGEAHLRHFAIRPEWARCGIGTALLLRCLSDARRLNIRKVHCFSTLNAEPFYRASGFDAVGPIDIPMGPSLTFPGVLMRCEL